MRLTKGRIEIQVKRIPAPFPSKVHAVTIWPFIFYESQVWDDKCIQIHERYHWIDQLRGLIIPWFIMYGILAVKYGGGREHPLERKAYQLQDKC